MPVWLQVGLDTEPYIRSSELNAPIRATVAPMEKPQGMESDPGFRFSLVE